MLAGVGLGYDWLYSYLSPTDRVTISSAIQNLGLEPLRVIMTSMGRGFHFQTGNHNMIPNSGLIIAALAIAEKDYSYATNMMKSLPLFRTDGGWDEGIGYCGFALDMFCSALACLESSLGTDLGLTTVNSGFAKTGDFRVHMQGSPYTEGGLSFTYADMRTDGMFFHTPSSFYLASKYSMPLLARSERVLSSWKTPTVFNLIWYSNADADPDATAPLNKVFPGVGIASMRTGWKDPNAAWVAFKRG
jgi:hypothetical protein